MTMLRTENAMRHRFAHLTSVRLKHPSSSSLSESVLDDSQLSGALSGQSRTKIPASQNRGNTRRAIEVRTRVEERDESANYSQKPNLNRYIASVGGSATDA